MLRMLVIALAALAAVNATQRAAAQSTVWRPPAGSFSIDLGAAGWAQTGASIDDALLVVSPVNDRTLMCALFRHDDVHMPDPVSSQADLDAAIAARTGPATGYDLIRTNRGPALAGRTYAEDGGFWRHFSFGIWETDHIALYNMSCGGTSMEQMRTPALEALARAIQLP